MIDFAWDSPQETKQHPIDSIFNVSWMAGEISVTNVEIETVDSYDYDYRIKP